MAQHSHYFIGIPIKTDLQQQLANYQTEIKANYEHLFKLWTHPNDFHITLKFLGPVSDVQLIELLKQLQQIDDVQPFEIGINNLGVFGNRTKPRVLWAGVENHSKLIELHKTVEEKCSEVGFSMENRPYRPHITLAKKWNGKKVEMDNFYNQILNYNKTMKQYIDYFVVYKIHPSRSPKYEVIEKFYLHVSKA